MTADQFIVLQLVAGVLSWGVIVWVLLRQIRRVATAQQISKTAAALFLFRGWLASWDRRAPDSAPLDAPATGSASAGPQVDGLRWLLVGAPGTGKSTAARALIRSYLRTGADVTILDPDGSAWPRGARMVGSPDDYPAIEEALARTQTIASERRAQFQRGTRTFAPLLVVIDEAPSVLRSTPGAIDTVADLARRGRKLAISIAVITQDTQAKTLGIEGMTKLLSAFDRLDCQMTPTGVALSGVGINITVPLDYDAQDLVLPLFDEVEVVPTTVAVGQSTPLETIDPVDANRLLRDALGISGINGSTAFDSAVDLIAERQTGHAVVVDQRVNTSRNEAELLPPDVAQRIAAIDWRTVAELVEGRALGETAALKTLGFTPGSASVKYQVARERLQAARAALREVSAKG